ncbi:MAG: hypothetical protein LBB49_02030 [Gracilibacteraceae bacterium]|nr:hypothetical protein [Gracilibacteraceae bacterium]
MIEIEWEQAKRDLEEIMSADEYSGYEDGFVSSGQMSSRQAPSLEESTPVELPGWLRDFLQWVQDIFDGLFSGVTIHGNFWAVILALCLVVFVVFVVWLILRMKRDARLRTKVSNKVSDVNKTCDECFSEADDYAARHDYAQAIRLLFMAFIIFLNQKGWIQLRSWKTNGQYLRELRSRQNEFIESGIVNAHNSEMKDFPDNVFPNSDEDTSSNLLYKEFSHIAGSFEDVFYGGFPPTSDMYTQCRTRALAWMGKEAVL